MNSLVHSQLQEIQRQTEALRRAVAGVKSRQALATQDHERLLQEQWRLKKEMATLQRVSDDYDDLMAENKRLDETIGDVRNRLRKVLACTKALVAEYKP